MIVTLASSESAERLLVRSDLPDVISARREVESWATARGIRIPRMALRLRVQSPEETAREWTVLDRPAQALPPGDEPPVPARLATRRNIPLRASLPDFLQLVQGAA